MSDEVSKSSAALLLARQALGNAASLRLFDEGIGGPGPPLEEKIAALIRPLLSVTEAAIDLLDELMNEGVVSVARQDDLVVALADLEPYWEKSR